MVQATWEKTQDSTGLRARTFPKNTKFAIVGGVLLFGMAMLILAGTLSNGQYFITIKTMLARTDLAGQTIKVSGAVIGSTIHFDSATQTISFTMANVSDNMDEIAKAGGLADALHQAVIDPTAPQVKVQVVNQPMPDLLKNEAQAIVTGKMGADGIFHADELLLKCPSKYSSDLPQQSAQ